MPRVSDDVKGIAQARFATLPDNRCRLLAGLFMQAHPTQFISLSGVIEPLSDDQVENALRSIVTPTTKRIAPKVADALASKLANALRASSAEPAGA